MRKTTRKAERRETAAMAKGYKAMAKEQKQLVAMTAKIEHEVIPEWK